MSISENITNLKKELPNHVCLVAVSKTKPIPNIMEAYNAGHRIFGENKIQEMVDKWEQMPKDIEWHMIGHVQTNKVKYMAEFVSLIHAVDSVKLLKEINKQAKKHERVIDCLLQIKIAKEDSKFGMTEADALALLNNASVKEFENVNIVGLMGMATFTENEAQLVSEFSRLKNFFDTHKTAFSFKTLSMGMSGDYKIAIAQGSTMIRVGSSIFGERYQ
ncbi:YggS family pyridoxal phosphate-dependent enzyme [Aureisphaera sp. CAU 1614]|uniref:Pyridoxal phosphate homeostasis protein n=1 Tax=Halomarinibacterium sedimenti TaxID=2857106 RepID=A0A9X1FRA4_9FLAO|nr:YggS family pyridoxal phosphate-dependent enzyme [Halomarinibacterium sedimenti]MBW2938382.1 YggS family pyridoxal phosphate-dependent enzyme [Halomarinibacterium sedimenti]